MSFQFWYFFAHKLHTSTMFTRPTIKKPPRIFFVKAKSRTRLLQNSHAVETPGHWLWVRGSSSSWVQMTGVDLQYFKLKWSSAVMFAMFVSTTVVGPQSETVQIFGTYQWFYLNCRFWQLDPNLTVSCKTQPATSFRLFRASKLPLSVRCVAVNFWVIGPVVTLPLSWTGGRPLLRDKTETAFSSKTKLTSTERCEHWPGYIYSQKTCRIWQKSGHNVTDNAPSTADKFFTRQDLFQEEFQQTLRAWI